MLVLATLFWAGNFIIGKAAFVENIPPMSLVFYRWTLVWIILLPFTELPEFARRYVVTVAGRRFQARYLGSKELAGFSEQDELAALTTCEQLDAANEKQNILKGDVANRIVFRNNHRRFY